MAERMNDADWTILPTKKTLDAMIALSDFNKTADVNKRKRFTEVSLTRRPCNHPLTVLGTTRTRI